MESFPLRAALLAMMAAWLLDLSQACAWQPATTADATRQNLAVNDQLVWRGQTLRDGLTNLIHSWNTPVFLDRRIDPDQLVDFESSHKTRIDILRELATQLGVKVCVVDTVVYVGPAATADVLASVAEARWDEAGKTAGTLGRALRKRTELKWDEASEPREILEGIAARSGTSFTNLDLVPHDLWPAAHWRSVPVTHQLALVLAGFGYTFEFEQGGRRLNLVPLPDEFQLVREYPATGTARQRIAALEEQFPDASITLRGNRVAVAGSAEDHYWIRRKLAGLGDITPRPVNREQLRYTLNIEQQPFGAVAETLAKALNLELQYDERVQNIKTQRISFSTRDATSAELLDALVQSVRLRYTIKDQVLMIHP